MPCLPIPSYCSASDIDSGNPCLYKEMCSNGLYLLSTSTQCLAMCQKYRTQRYRHPLILKPVLSLKPCCFFISSEVISLLHPIKFYYFSTVFFPLHCYCFRRYKKMWNILLLSFVILDSSEKTICADRSDLGCKTY